MEKPEKEDNENPELNIIKDAHFAGESELTARINEMTMNQPSLASLVNSNSEREMTNRIIDMPPMWIPQARSKEEDDEFQSAGALLRRLHGTILLWKKSLTDDMQPAILAILYGGIQIQVTRLIAETFHGIRIEGTMNGSSCMILAHQSTVQLLCMMVPIDEGKEVRKPIGFMFEGKEQNV